MRGPRSIGTVRVVWKASGASASPTTSREQPSEAIFAKRRATKAARDLDGFGSGRSPRERRFEGVITHRGPVVRGVADALEEWIGFQLG